jgi:hypothetical protein
MLAPVSLPGGMRVIVRKECRTPGPTAVWAPAPANTASSAYHRHEGRTARRSGLRHRRRAAARTGAPRTPACAICPYARTRSGASSPSCVRAAGLDADARFTGPGRRWDPTPGAADLLRRPADSSAAAAACGSAWPTLTLLIMSERRPIGTRTISVGAAIWLVLLSGGHRPGPTAKNYWVCFQ